MITLLQKIYEKAQSAVRIGNNQGEWFHTNAGIRQGDPLSPLLFITYLERVMDHVKESNYGIRLSGVLVNNLRFADDINLIDEDYKSLQEQLEKTRAIAEQAGLFMNIGKTKTMVFGDRKIGQEIQIGDKNIENVDKLEYLGSLITWDNNCSEVIRRQIGKAAGTIASLRHIWNGKKLTVQNKRRILATCAFSVLLYASETWTLKETDKKKLLAFEMKCYRRILRINWKDMIRNKNIRKTIAREETIIDTIKKRKLRQFGHICTMHDNRLKKHTIFAKTDGKPPRGRPCREWMDDIKDWCGRSGQDLLHLAQDRRMWKKLIRTVVGPNGQ